MNEIDLNDFDETNLDNISERLDSYISSNALIEQYLKYIRKNSLKTLLEKTKSNNFKGILDFYYDRLEKRMTTEMKLIEDYYELAKIDKFNIKEQDSTNILTYENYKMLILNKMIDSITALLSVLVLEKLTSHNLDKNSNLYKMLMINYADSTFNFELVYFDFESEILLDKDKKEITLEKINGMSLKKYILENLGSTENEQEKDR